MRYAPNPVTHVVTAKEELEILYVQHNFDALLPSCTSITICHDYYSETNQVHPGTIEIRGVKYIHMDGYSVAVIFNYVHVDGKKRRSIRMLRIENTVHNAAPLP
jgi:hypothetical protein